MTGLIDWIFRPRCAACGDVVAEGRPLCEPCAGTLVELGPACPRCAEPAGDEWAGARAVAAICRRCAVAPLPLDRIAVPWRFGGQLAVAIRRLKFTGHAHVARELAPLWAPVIAAAAAELGGGAVVVPVPVHWRRRLTRGYDQVWLLARYACAAAGLPPPVVAVRRVRGAAPQSTLAAAARRENLRGAFEVPRPEQIAGRAVILVDDVVTTGSTLAAAAGPLRAAGAACVIGVALARATSARG